MSDIEIIKYIKDKDKEMSLFAKGRSRADLRKKPFPIDKINLDSTEGIELRLLDKNYNIETPKEKICTKCKENKPIEEFSVESRKPDGYKSQCKACTSLWFGEYFKKNRTKLTFQKRLGMYGLTEEEFDFIKNSQKFSCKICNTHESELRKNLYIDHNHETGKVRGLLCNDCNSALGFVKENIDTLSNMINYIKEHNGNG